MRLNIHNNVLLATCVVLLALLCVLSVDEPLRFSHEQAVREKTVRAQLDKILSAERQYRRQKGVYTGSFDVLAAAGLLNRADRYIPYSGGQCFDLEATSEVGKSGRSIPQISCGARYVSYLKGLDKEKIAELTVRAESAGDYPGLQVSDGQ